MANFYAVDAASSGGGGGSGITSINGDTTSAQLIVGATTPGLSAATVGGTTTIDQHVADATHNGYLSSTDWSTFNSKQAALTIGNLTDAGTDGIVVTSGTGAVIGSGTSLAQHVSDSTHNGYLSSTDWSTFNGKQNALTNPLTRLSTDQGAGRVFNKDFDDATTKVVDDGDTTKKLAFQLSGNATGITTTLAFQSSSAATLTFPDATDTLIGRTSNDTGAGRLQSKDFSSNNCKFVDSSDTTKSIIFSSSSNTTAKQLTLISACTLDRSITFPNATTNLVGDDTNNILTNKSISALTNTITNIANAEIKAAAAIAVNKLAALTISSNVRSDASGFLTTGAINLATADVTGTLPIGNGGTGQTTANPAFNALSPQTTKGDLIGFSTVAARLGVGSNNQILIADSAQTLGIKWGAYPTATATVGGIVTTYVPSQFNDIVTKTSTDYTILDNDGFQTILFTTANTSYVCNLPNISGTTQGRILSIKKLDSGTGTVTVTGVGGNIDGTSTRVLSIQNDSITVTSDGSNWRILGTYSTTLTTDPTAMSDIVATRMGYKFYAHGTSYNGSIAPTITLTAGGGTLSSVQLGQFTPKQNQDGSWRVVFNIKVTVSSATRTTVTLAVNGLVFKNTGNQACCGFDDSLDAVSSCRAVGNTGNITMSHASGTSTEYSMSGDVACESKPTWAY